MKNIVSLIIVLLLLNTVCKSQVPDWTWVNIVGSSIDEQSYAIATDNDNNSIVGVEFYSDSITVGDTTHYNQGECDILLIKFDPNGIPLWSKSFGGDHYDYVQDIYVGDNDIIYFSGWYRSSTIMFDSIVLKNYGDMDAYVTKLDHDANVLHAEGIHGIGEFDFGIGVVADENGNYYITGEFVNDTLYVMDTIILNSGYLNNNADMYIIKFSADDELKWIRRSVGGGPWNNPQDICIAPDGYIYVTGEFDGDSIKFDTCTIRAYSDGGLFLAKYDLLGNIQYARNFTYYESFDQGNVTKITSDIEANVIIAGCYDFPEFIFNTDTLFNDGDGDLFICKFHSNGSELWAAGGGSDDNDFYISVVTDINCGIYTSGTSQTGSVYGKTITFSDFLSLTVYGSGGYIVKYDKNGVIRWAKTNSVLGERRTRVTGLGIDTHGSLFFLGQFMTDSITFGNHIYPSNGLRDVFVVKLEQIIVSKPENVFMDERITIYPNPAKDLIHINTDNSDFNTLDIKIFDLQGRLLKSVKSYTNNPVIDIGNLSDGIYILTVEDGNTSLFNNKILKW